MIAVGTRIRIPDNERTRRMFDVDGSLPPIGSIGRISSIDCIYSDGTVSIRALFDDFDSSILLFGCKKEAEDYNLFEVVETE